MCCKLFHFENFESLSKFENSKLETETKGTMNTNLVDVTAEGEHLGARSCTEVQGLEPAWTCSEVQGFEAANAELRTSIIKNTRDMYIYIHIRKSRYVYVYIYV